MSVISSILGPEFLIRQIGLISIILGGVVLALFSRYVNEKIIFPVADSLKEETHYRISRTIKHSKTTKYLSEAVATILFIIYCYFGASFLSKYVFSPILYSMREYLVIVLLVIFLLISAATNSSYFRKVFM